jgi:hypothetical protein
MDSRELASRLVAEDLPRGMTLIRCPIQYYWHAGNDCPLEEEMGWKRRPRVSDKYKLTLENADGDVAFGKGECDAEEGEKGEVGAYSSDASLHTKSRTR